MKDVSSLENEKQDTGEETMLEEQDKDEEVVKMKDGEVMEEEEEEKVVVEENAPSETQAGKDSEVQEVTGKEEQPAGSTAVDVKVEAEKVPEKEESDEDHLQNRFVKIICDCFIVLTLISTSHIMCFSKVSQPRT